MAPKSLSLLELYSLKEISSLSGISQNTLRTAIKSGSLISRKIGREYKCTKNEIVRFLNISIEDLVGFSK